MRPPPFSVLETVKKLIVHTTIIQQLPILLGGESEKKLSWGEVRAIRNGRFTEYQCSDKAPGSTKWLCTGPPKRNYDSHGKICYEKMRKPATPSLKVFLPLFQQQSMDPMGGSTQQSTGGSIMTPPPPRTMSSPIGAPPLTHMPPPGGPHMGSPPGMPAHSQGMMMPPPPPHHTQTVPGKGPFTQF